MKGEVIKAFPFAYDGINIEHLAVGAPFPADGRSVSASTFSGLETAGYIKTVTAAKVPPDEQLNRDIIDAFDRKLAGMSDADLKAVIARSGKPYSGNMVHATLVYAAKQQMLAELQGKDPVLGIDPESGVTEQPRAAPGQATPPSAAAAVEQQKAQAEAAKQAASTDVPLNEMTVAELKDYADKNQIDLGEATKKADILEIIEKAKG